MNARRLWLIAVIAVLIGGSTMLVRCGGSSSPTEPSSCANIAGTWTIRYANSCGGSLTDRLTITQNGCTVSGSGSGETITGTINGSTGTFRLTYSGTCSGSGTGTGSISGNTITGTYAAQISGGSACCTGQVTGSFTMTR
jgi:hypothetical protein